MDRTKTDQTIEPTLVAPTGSPHEIAEPAEVDPFSDAAASSVFGIFRIVQILDAGDTVLLQSEIGQGRFAKDQLRDPEVTAAAKRCIASKLKGYVSDILLIPCLCETFQISTVELSQMAVNAIGEMLPFSAAAGISRACKIIEICKANLDAFASPEFIKVLVNKCLNPDYGVVSASRIEDALLIAQEVNLPEGAFRPYRSNPQIQELLTTLAFPSYSSQSKFEAKNWIGLFKKYFQPDSDACSRASQVALERFYTPHINWAGENRYRTLLLGLEQLEQKPETMRVHGRSIAASALTLRDSRCPLYVDLVTAVPAREKPALIRQLKASLRTHGWESSVVEFIKRAGLPVDTLGDKSAARLGKKLLREEIDAASKRGRRAAKPAQIDAIIATFKLDQASVQLISEQAMLHAARKGGFQSAFAIIEQMGLTKNTRVVENFERLVCGRIARFNSLSNRVRRFCANELPFRGLYCDDYIRKGAGYSALGSLLLSPASPEVAICSAAFFGFVWMAKVLKTWTGDPQKTDNKHPIQLSKELLDLKFSESTRKDPKSIGWVRDQIALSIQSDNLELAQGLAKSFDISLSNHPGAVDFIKRKLTPNFIKLPRPVKELVAIVDILELSVPQREEIRGSVEFWNFCVNHLCDSDEPAQLDRVHEAYGCKNDMIRSMAIESVEYLVSEGFAVRALNLMERYELLRDDFEEGEFQEDVAKLMFDAFANGNISLAEKLRNYTAQSLVTELDPTFIREQVVKTLRAATCPDNSEDIRKILEFAGLESEATPQENQQTLRVLIPAVFASHLKHGRPGRALALFEAFHLDKADLQPQVLRYLASIVASGSIADIRKYLTTFECGDLIVSSKTVRAAAIDRAYYQLERGYYAAADYFAQLAHMSEKEKEASALEGCQRLLRQRNFLPIYQMCGYWGINEQIPIIHLIPEKNLNGVSINEGDTLGAVIDKNFEQVLSPKRALAWSGSDANATSHTSHPQRAEEATAYLKLRIERDPTTVRTKYNVPEYRQDQSFACGACSASMGLESILGKHITEKRMIEILNTTFDDGTPLRQFAHLSDHFHGIDVKIAEQGSLQELQELMNEGYLIIVNYSPFGPHYAVLTAIGKKGACFNDPARGKIVMSIPEFFECWHGGYANTGKTTRGYVAIRPKEKTESPRSLEEVPIELTEEDLLQ